MKKLSEKSRRLCRRLLMMIYRGLGVTAVSLIFQACYGMPPDMGDDVVIHGSVRAKETSKPIQGIRVSIADTFDNYTSSKGNFYVYVPRQDYYTVKFEDIDGPENGGLFKTYEITVYASKSALRVDLEEDE